MMELMLYGTLGQFLSAWSFAWIGLASVTGTILSVTLFLHRSQAHRGVNLHPIVDHNFRLWLWLTTGMVTKEWVAIHRKHHAFTDRIGWDPHTPRGKGFWEVLFLVLDYVRAVRYMNHQEYKNTGLTEIAYYARGTPDDWLERHVYAKHPVFGVILGALTAITLFGVFPGGLIVLAHAVWIPFWAACVVNGVGHLYGYRNFETPDQSQNILPWGLVIGGEELHNNHHAFPTSAKFSMRWYEFDIGWVVIVILSFFGLATVKRRAPRLKVDRTRIACDEATLEAILGLRLEVLRRLDWALAKARRAKTEATEKLTEYRQEFLALVEHSRLSQDELLIRLKKWRQHLATSPSPVLQRFALSLQWYTLKRV